MHVQRVIESLLNSPHAKGCFAAESNRLSWDNADLESTAGRNDRAYLLNEVQIVT